MVAAPAFLPSSRTFRCEPSSSASVPLTTPSPRALQWQRHRLWPRSARLHRGPPCATATDGVSPRSQPEAPAASSAPWLTADPCTDTTAFVGRGPAPTTAAPLSAHHDARSLLRRRRLARSSVSPSMLGPILETLPLAVVMKPLGTGVALDTPPRPRATSRASADSPEPRQCLGTTSRTQRPRLGHAGRSWLAHDRAGNVTLGPAMALAHATSADPRIRLMRCAQRLELSCEVPSEARASSASTS